MTSAQHPLTAPGSKHPIGVFDSGVGGLSILQAQRACQPAASLAI